MKKHRRRLTTLLLHSGMGAAMVLGALQVQAVTLGHSRVTSAPDQPLRIVVQIKELSALDLQSLSAHIAPLEAWQAAGLRPPVELDSLSTRLLPGIQDNGMQLVLQSRLVPTDKVLDVLVELSTAASTQRHQVSVLQTQPPVAIQLAETTAAKPPRAALPAPASTDLKVKGSKPNTHLVKQGDTLHGIARNLRDRRYTDQQLMAALVEANPQAFIDGNMNRLSAGVRLTIPEPETVTAISPQQAREFYQIQLKQFDEYRQRIAKGEPPATTASTELEKKAAREGATGEAPVIEDVVIEKSAPETNTDRLQLSAESDEVAKKDQQTATAQELAHTAERLRQLESGDTTSNAAEVTVVEQLEAVPDMDIAKELVVDDKSLSSPVAMTEVLASATINAHTTNELTAGAEPTRVSESKASWWKTNVLSVAIGGFVLLVLVVAWFLRRAYSTRMEYAEIVPKGTVHSREKTDTAEAEFRKIK